MIERLRKYIDEHYVPAAEEPPAQLLAALQGRECGFTEKLLSLIDGLGLKDSEFYERANLSRQTFYRMRMAKDYRPTRATAFACAVALKLDREQTEDLLRSAGITFSNSSLTDIIVRFFIENGMYDLDEINAVLYDYDQPLLGGS